MIPKPAVDHYRTVQREQARAALEARRVWRAVDPAYISESLTEALPALESAVSGGQLRAATSGSAYAADTLAAQGLYTKPDAFVNPAALAGTSSRGAPLSSSLYSPAPYVKGLIADGMPTTAAMSSGRKLLEKAASTQVTDAGRTASSMDTFARQGVVWTRMIGPTACPRCIILAGRIYRNNEGFLRHPGCACIHVSTSVEAAQAEGLITDPYEAFESMSEADQDARFTKAGAQAIRDGGDISQVVNARRGLSYAGTSSDGSRRGQRVTGSFTREGTTRRGYFGRTSGSDFEKVAGSRYQRSTTRRLTPDAIYQQNLPREDTLQLLRDNGYLLRQGQVPEGAIRGLGAAFTDPNALTAAQRRVQTASLDWEAVQEGRNPYGKGPLTPQASATAEKNYRRWLLSGGQIYTR
ncbi:hypothetical protein ACHABQ_02955 [Nesterenkonia aurantiaca]|uniref:hypothetical protein n=1 Tax=Nesterenkonia aurantiaca TaxID=1436010 RepID=UPI003EE810E8